MRDELEPAREDDSWRIKRTMEYAEELSKMIQNLNTALSRGDFEEFREILSEVKYCIFELENYLNMLD